MFDLMGSHRPIISYVNRDNSPHPRLGTERVVAIAGTAARPLGCFWVTEFASRRSDQTRQASANSPVMRVSLLSPAAIPVSGASALTRPLHLVVEQQPSKLKVAGSNPAGVANDFNSLSRDQVFQ